MRRISITLAALALAATACVAATPAASVRWTENGKEAVGTLAPSGQGYPACDPGVKQISGYFNIDSTTDKHYFFWMFEAKKNPSTAPVLLWMTGGPGCSSGLAILAENGPCHMNEETGHLYSNPYSWNNVANVIYIDQPAGVGFSYASSSGYDSNETQVGNDMYHFMQAFYAAYPQYLNNELFVYGESYGGHFAPATAHRIWQGNNAGGSPQMPLRGLSVGNGMTQPEIQLSWYAHLAYEWCNVVKGAPCIDQISYDVALSMLPTCIQKIKACNGGPVANSSCEDAMNFCLETQLGPYENTGLNVYDMRKPCIGSLCYNFSNSVAFFNRPDVQTSLGVASQNIQWQVCSMTVNEMFGLDWMRNFDGYVKDLLNSDIRVLIYSGDMDFICNWLGNKAWTMQLGWNNHSAFAAAHDFPWWVEEMPAGRVRTVSSAKNQLAFTFLQIHGAGHMVPMDQPARALAMVEHFLGDKPFTLYDEWMA